MDITSFFAFSRRRQTRDDLTPESDKVVPLIAQAGQKGMTRAEIGGVIDLDREVLDSLLLSLLKFNILSLSTNHRGPVYRIRTGLAGLSRLSYLP
jgi:hypothetical protein